MNQTFKQLLLGTALCCGTLAAQAQGLEDIIVEEYHTITAADVLAHPGGGSYPLVAGMKVYRVYVDMAPNYKLNTVFGSPETVPGSGISPNKLDFSTTTTFWNDDNFGSEVPGQTRRFDEGTAFDSYVTVNTTGIAGGTAGCGVATQQFGVLRTADTDGDLTTCGVYPGFTGNDGNIPGTGPALTYNIGGLVDFTALTGAASSLEIINDSYATLPNGTGVDPLGTNRVLIGQFTTDGAFSFHINVQLSSPLNQLETYVWRQAGAGEQYSDKLTYPRAAFTGCSSSQSPYVLPLGTGKSTTSILTVGDLIGGYDLVGIPDGMGAFDNGNGTFTLLVNHELGATVGITRAHGFAGSFVSKWVIDKSTLCVQSGADLITNLQQWNTGTSSFEPATAPIGRLCSGDLPPVSAFFNAGTGKGTTELIYMNGEEVGAEGRAFAHIVTGPNAGTSYQLPYLGRFSWENSVANPASADKTVVVGTDDTTPGQVYVYVGAKQSSGTEIEKAGLQDGVLYGLKVTGLALETNVSFPNVPTPFSLFSFGDVSATTGAALQTASVANGVTEFLRPEDAHWDPSNPNVLYFVTTNNFTSPSRMYKVTFTDILQPELGGTIVAVVDGTESAGQRMMDNMTVDQRGGAYIQEDPGNQSYLARIHKYDIAGDVLTPVAEHDPNRFLVGGTNFLTQDEESSGIIDMQDILGKGKYLFNVQAHYSIPGELVEGGQLLMLATNDTAQACVPPAIASITAAQSLCSDDTLALDVVATGTLPVTYSWSGSGTFLFGNSSSSALVTGAASGDYTVIVSNACGTANGSVNVTVTPAVSSTTTETACGSYLWTVNGQTYNTSGTYVNVAGCTTDTLILTVNIPGTPCDDGNAGTINDTFDGTCACVGTPAPCGGNEVEVLIQTDANGDQITWDIQDGLFNIVASGGPYTGQNNVLVSETICLPNIGGDCYGFQLQDAFGDGLIGGSWELRDSTGAVILRDGFNGSNGSVSPANPPAQAAYGDRHPFCLPAGPASILPEHCGVFTNTQYNKVFCTSIPGAVNYQFEFTDPDAGFRRRIAVPRNWVRFSEMTSVPLIPGVVYFAHARVDQGAAGFTDDKFGAGCELGLTTQTNCTSLIDQPGSATNSCDVTRAFGGSAKVWAYPVAGATQYRFRFVNTGLGFTRVIARSSYVCPLNWVTQPLVSGVTYDVTVEVLVNGIWSGYCGAVCDLTIMNAPEQAQQRSAAVDAEAEMLIFPNPTRDGAFTVQVSGVPADVRTATVEVVDLFGRQVVAQQIAVDGPVNSRFELGSAAAGVYMVTFTAGEAQWIQRLVVQH